MLVMHAMKLMRWMMLLSVIALAQGCAAVPGNFCGAAQKPFDWESDAEIDSASDRLVRYIEEGDANYRRQGCK